MTEGRHQPKRDGRLLVECWCMADVLEVPAQRVREGRTASCGRPGCDEPKHRRR